MKERMRYEAPRTQVRGVFLEAGIAFDSRKPYISGSVEYNEYEEIELLDNSGKDITIF
jgi:hypothetical protein